MHCCTLSCLAVSFVPYDSKDVLYNRSKNVLFSKMSWNNESELNFLEVYQMESVLWDPSHRFHKDKKHLHDAWVRISEETGFSIADLKKKKDSLMATYRAHLRKIKNSQHTGAGLEEIYKPVWFAFELMNSFLARLYECKKSMDTVNKNVPSQLHASEECDGEILSESEPRGDESTTRDQSMENNTDLELASPSPSTQRRRKNPPELQEAGKNMTEAISTLNKVLNAKKVTTAEDDCDRYGKILGNKLRTLPEIDRLQLMYEIDGLFIRKKQLALLQQQDDHFLPSAKRRYYAPSPTHSPRQLSSPFSSYSEPVMSEIPPHRPPSSYSLPPSIYSPSYINSRTPIIRNCSKNKTNPITFPRNATIK